MFKNLKEIEERIYRDIPLAALMGLKILPQKTAKVSSPSLELDFPLKPNNTNHLGTAFGGSLYASCALACYSLLLALLSETPDVEATNDIVIAGAEIKYLKPVENSWRVQSFLSKKQNWSLKLKKLKQLNKIKLSFEAHVVAGSKNEICANFCGSYVVFLKQNKANERK